MRHEQPIQRDYQAKEFLDFISSRDSVDFKILARLGYLIFLTNDPRDVFDTRTDGSWLPLLSSCLYLPEFRFLMDFFSREDEGTPVDLVPTLAISSDEEYANMVAADAHPLLFSLSGSLYLHGGYLHPYMALLHDFYHVALTQLLEKNLRTIRIAVYQAIKNLQKRYHSQAQMNGEVIGLTREKIIFSNYTNFQQEFLELDLLQTIEMHGQRWRGLFAGVNLLTGQVRGGILPDLVRELSLQLQDHPLQGVVLAALVGEAD